MPRSWLLRWFFSSADRLSCFCVRAPRAGARPAPGGAGRAGPCRRRASSCRARSNRRHADIRRARLVRAEVARLCHPTFDRPAVERQDGPLSRWSSITIRWAGGGGARRAHEGRVLGEMAEADVFDLLKEFRSDAESVALLETYLDGRFPGWREDAHADRKRGEEWRHARAP